ncbi:MAG: CHASE2 domain-containing protein [Gammaproteobacteria bacterium]
MRPVLSAVIAIVLWLTITAGWMRNTVLPVFDQQFRDFYLTLTVDSRADDAPGLLHLVFDNEALASHGLPTRVPIQAIYDMLEVARHSAQTVVLDIDLATRSDPDAVDGLARYLAAWSADPDAALLTLAYPIYDVPYREQTAFLRMDEVVQASPNIRWAGVGTYADADGVIRHYEFWTCLEDETERPPVLLPSVAVFIWARHASVSAVVAADTVGEAFRDSAPVCTGGGAPGLALGSTATPVPQTGLIEYQTSVDAVTADAGETGQFAPDGFPRLMSVGYCRINPGACGDQAGPARLAELAADRIVLISAANDFSRDEHATPVGFMAGSVILGNAGRALINSGPPMPASKPLQLVILLLAVVVISVVWALSGMFSRWIRSHVKRAWLFKTLNGIFNPGLVQWLAFAAADVLIFFYYFFFFATSGWNGLMAASLGATTMAAIIAFTEWLSTPWEQERLEDGS